MEMKKTAAKKTAAKKTKLNHICDLVDGYIDEEITETQLIEKLMKIIGKPIIEISDMQYVVYEEKNSSGTNGIYLCCRAKLLDGTRGDWVDVSDLTELRVWEYNELVDALQVHYPDYPIETLEGRFV